MIHGVEVDDPYRWLEDGQSAETIAWAAEQNARTRTQLDAVPSRDAFHARLTELFRAGTSGAPRIEGGRLFSLDRWGDHDQAVLCVRPLEADSPPAPTVVIDSSGQSGDATTAIDWFHPSRDGRFVAYGTSASGDERSTLRIIDVESGDHLRSGRMGVESSLRGHGGLLAWGARPIAEATIEAIDRLDVLAENANAAAARWPTQQGPDRLIEAILNTLE